MKKILFAALLGAVSLSSSAQAEETSTRGPNYHSGYTFHPEGLMLGTRRISPNYNKTVVHRPTPSGNKTGGQPTPQA